MSCEAELWDMMFVHDGNFLLHLTRGSKSLPLAATWSFLLVKVLYYRHMLQKKASRNKIIHIAMFVGLIISYRLPKNAWGGLAEGSCNNEVRFLESLTALHWWSSSHNQATKWATLWLSPSWTTTDHAYKCKPLSYKRYNTNLQALHISPISHMLH